MSNLYSTFSLIHAAHGISYLFTKTGKHLLLGQDNSSQQLVFQSFHSYSEVNDGRPGVDLWRVCWVRQLGCYVQFETFHYINFFVTNFHLHQCLETMRRLQRKHARRVFVSFVFIKIIKTLIATEVVLYRDTRE